LRAQSCRANEIAQAFSGMPVIVNDEYQSVLLIHDETSWPIYDILSIDPKKKFKEPYD
jgi:hypothetical protein